MSADPWSLELRPIVTNEAIAFKKQGSHLGIPTRSCINTKIITFPSQKTKSFSTNPSVIFMVNNSICLVLLKLQHHVNSLYP